MTFADRIRASYGYHKSSYDYYPVLIIGAGESGLAMGCRLREKLGFDQFRIFDRQSGIGGSILSPARGHSPTDVPLGTWWINRYPGVVGLSPLHHHRVSQD